MLQGIDAPFLWMSSSSRQLLGTKPYEVWLLVNLSKVPCPVRLFFPSVQMKIGACFSPAVRLKNIICLPEGLGSGASSNISLANNIIFRFAVMGLFVQWGILQARSASMSGRESPMNDYDDILEEDPRYKKMAPPKPVIHRRSATDWGNFEEDSECFEFFPFRSFRMSLKFRLLIAFMSWTIVASVLLKRHLR